MRRIAFILFLLTFFTGLTAFTYDILKKLEVAEKEANDYIFNNLRFGNLNFPRTDAIKQVAVGDKAGVVIALGDYMRRYVESEEFKKAYQEARKTVVPQGNSADLETLLKERINDLESQITSAEENLKKASGDMKKLYEFTLSELKKEYKALSNSKDPNHALYKRNLEETEVEKEEENAADVEAQRKEAEKYFPADPKVLIKSRLQEFLTLTADIDFNAKLIKQGDVMKFADPKLEAKSTLWKRCFRSGKETITAARAYAQQWLKELK